MAQKPSIYPNSGDIELDLGDTHLVLKCTLQAGLSISRQAGGIRGAIDKVMAMDIDTIVSVIRAGVGPEARKLKDLERMVFENGLTDAQGEVLGKIVEYLFNLARGGRPAPTDEEESQDPTPTPQEA